MTDQKPIGQGDRWIKLSTAARIAGVSSRALRYRLRRMHAASGVRILRRFGAGQSQGHWHVDVGAFAAYMQADGAIDEFRSAISSRLDLVEDRQDTLRNSFRKHAMRISRLEGRQSAKRTKCPP